MLIKAKELNGCKLEGTDGVIGSVKELYFDDLHWTIRYLVADTGNWISDRRVLLSPYAVDAINKKKNSISIKLTKKQIEQSPPLESDKPVSRQYEESYYGYYGWPMYWGGPFMWGYYPDIVRDPTRWKKTISGDKKGDPNLRSTIAVDSFGVHAQDGEIGHVEDFIIDDVTWAIRYLIVDTRNWWPGKKVLVSTKWIKDVSWGESKIFVKLSREKIKESPEYSPELLLTREFEEKMHKHYKMPGYWLDEKEAEKHKNK
jgi:hypothetical protein